MADTINKMKVSGFSDGWWVVKMLDHEISAMAYYEDEKPPESILTDGRLAAYHEGGFWYLKKPD